MATADPKKKKKKRKKKESLEHKRNRILVALGIFAVVYALDELGALTIAFGEPGNVYASFVLFLVPFLIAGYDVLQKAYNNIRRGKAFDESFLMAVATIGAFAMVLFPDTDPAFKDADSLKLLAAVADKVRAEGYAILDVDSVIAAQAPKLSPHRDAMRANLAAAMGIPVENVGVKATTTEHLGFEGREEGISATAACLLCRCS